MLMRSQFLFIAGDSCSALATEYSPFEDHCVAGFAGVKCLTAVLTEIFIGSRSATCGAFNSVSHLGTQDTFKLD